MSCYFVQCINVLLYKTCLKRPSQSGAVAAPGSRGRCCSSDAPLRLKRNSRRNKWRLSSAQQLISDRARQQEPLRGKHTAPGFLRSEDELRISRRTSPGRGALAEIVGEGGGPNPAKTPPNPPAVADGRRCCVPPGPRSFALWATGAGQMFPPRRCWRDTVAAMGITRSQPSSASA